MTKDRRLGRGLAALLGTPLDETNIVDGLANEAADNSAVAPRPTSRPLTDAPAAAEASPRMAAQPIAGHVNPTSASAAGMPATVSRSQAAARPRSPAVAQGAAGGGVTGSVPLSSVLPDKPETVGPDSAPVAASIVKSSTAVRSMRGEPSTEPAAATAQLAASGNSSKSVAAGQALEIDVSLIDANPFQPRRQFNDEEIASLAESIKEHQQLQPVLVRKVGSRYQLISGERRLRATIHAGLTKVRAEVREADDRLVAELAIVENLQRKDLNPIEKALSFRRYLDEHACTQDELAKRLKIDRSTIANLMRLLELPPTILEAVQSDRLSAGHARALLPLGEEAEQCSMAAKIQAEGWNVRQTEHAVSEMLAAESADRGAKPAKGKRGSARTVTPQIGSLEQELRRSLGTKIEIRQSARGRGKIVVHFHSAEEFERIRELLVPAGQRAAA